MINHKEAYKEALKSKDTSNLARCYLELFEQYNIAPKIEITKQMINDVRAEVEITTAKTKKLLMQCNGDVEHAIKLAKFKI